MTRYDQVKIVCDQVLKFAGRDEAEVIWLAQDDSLTRFANNTIHQNVTERNAILTVRLFVGKRAGLATTNRTDPATLDELVRRARTNAIASPEDPNYPGLAEPAGYTTLPSFDDETAEFSPRKRAEGASLVCRLAEEKGLNASGAFSSGFAEAAVANTQGVFAYHRGTHADFVTVVMDEDASGQAHASSWQIRNLNPEALGREAIAKTESGRNPHKIDPGEYSVVFDPYVTQDILSSLNFYGISAQAVLEGRSWMNNRQGLQAMSSLVSIWDDGQDLSGEPMPFDFEGTPKKRVDIVRQGEIGEPVHDRYTARKAGVASTGHAVPPAWRSFGPMASNLFMAPGDASIDEMIHTTERGLYITRFWYTRLVHPRDCVVTGMTRDGVYMIEHGEITFPVKNLRFTQSYVHALADVQSVGKELRVLTSQGDSVAFVVPGLKIGRFNFTGNSG